jgi:hypothetical protein
MTALVAGRRIDDAGDMAACSKDKARISDDQVLFEFLSARKAITRWTTF